jgi:tetratricopeptide (TPR) repeat protein
MLAENIQSSLKSTAILKLWTPSAISLMTFFLGFPSGIALASINWIRMGMKGKAVAHVAGGVVGILVLILFPDNLGRLLGLVINIGYTAYLRQQMKDDIATITHANVQYAHWFSGFLISMATLGTIVIVAVVLLTLQVFIEGQLPGHALYYSNRGDSYLKNGNYDQAIAEYTQAIELDPSLASFYYNRGLAYSNKADYDNAISDFSQVIMMNPKDGEAYFERGYNYSMKDDLELAIADYTQVIQLDPKNVYAYNNRGLSFENLGQKDEAIKDFETVLELTNDPNLTQGVEEELLKLKGK